ncbi:MAG: hypothetical protein ABEJ65_10300, partial [bacterium]
MVNLIIEFVNYITASAWIITTISIVIFFLGLRFYKTITKPPVAISIAFVLLVLFGLCMLNPWFYSQVTKAKHVPAVAVLFLFGFFGWLAMRQAAINDYYIERGMEIPEKAEAEKDVLTWPDLVFTEFISTLFVSAILMVWSMVLQAPLEEPASATSSPNPAKAPWYFLGLQELLVYYDPWIAGVIIPTLIIVGLMAVPYIDRNPRGSGYYTFAQRPLAVTFFLFGWYVLWMLQIFVGTFLRGPNWAKFGLFEKWNTMKATSALNITLSDVFWVDWLGMVPPSFNFPEFGTTMLGLVNNKIHLVILHVPINPFIQELPGFVVLGLYFIVPTLIFARTWGRDLLKKLGIIRFG